MKVIKRDQTEEQFDLSRIKDDIAQAFQTCEKKYDEDVIDFLTLKVTSDLSSKIKRNKISVENIQDSVESVLIRSDYEDVAKQYILYRKHREKLREADKSLIDYKKIVDSYVDVADWRVKENSTVSYSVGGLILSNSGAITANYWLSEIYDKDIADAHRNADIHIHDLSMLTGYCAGWSLKDLIKEGLGGVTGKITSSPASHLSTLCNQMVNFLGIMQNEWAGAQAFSSFDTYLAPFVRVDNLTYKEVRQCIQSFLYGVNTPSRWGTQAPFTNITLDWTVPNDLAELNCIVGGKEMDFRYKDCKKEMDMINKAFIELMIEGDANGRGFQYPIPTYSITKDFDWSDNENNKLLFEMTSKYGTPYFSNYVNSDMEPSDIRSMCVTPETQVWYKVKGKTKHTSIEEMYNEYDVDDICILTKYGYRPIKEKQQFTYEGKLLKFVTDSGKTLITTPDHEHIIYDNLGLCKKKAFEISIGDSFSCRNPNPGEKRKGLTYEDCYGKEKAEYLKFKFSEDRKGHEAWNKGIPADLETRKKISNSLKGHYVSENCKQKSSERLLGDNNPYKKNGCYTIDRMSTISPYEDDFAEELSSLGLDFERQYYIKTEGRTYICDFYVPSKNLIIELETAYNFDKCSFNDFEYVIRDNLREKYEGLKELGYNVLIFNPKIDKSSYRSFINKTETIVKIEELDYNGYVYDVEVDCDDIEGDTTLNHSFYANEILTGNCCRLRLDLRELRKKSGGFFGSGENTGSVGVVTINLPRIAYLAKDEKDFYERLDHLMDLSARSLKIKRDVITKLLEQGLYPYTKRYLGNFNNHFSTIGLVGMNEAGLNANWLRMDLTHKETQQFAKDVLNHMRNRLSDYQEQYGDLYNLEATPAESTCFRLAKHDIEKYPDIITARKSCDDTPYYTNSSHLPVGYTEDVFSALDIQDELQTLYTSGTVFHAFLGEKLPDWKAAMTLVRKIAENYKLPYYTISPTYSVCTEHGYLSGEQSKCPICGKPTEVYSRITGYYRPVQNWNDGKAQEFRDRLNYNIGNSHLHKTITEEVKQTGEQNSCKECKIEEDVHYYLVTTKTCPNCKAIKAILEKNNIPYKNMYVDENEDFVEMFGIKMAPTLVDLTTNKTYSGVSNIKKYLDI